jgi:hypothetical protein
MNPSCTACVLLTTFSSAELGAFASDMLCVTTRRACCHELDHTCVVLAVCTGIRKWILPQLESVDVRAVKSADDHDTRVMVTYMHA